MKVGVILSRCQPLHNGHIEMVNKALSENDKVLFIIGRNLLLKINIDSFLVVYYKRIT